MNVLVVEDERKTAALIREAFQSEHFGVQIVHDGREGLERALSTVFDAIILDIMLPKLDGLSVLRQLREQKVRTPILLLSARGQVNERVEGLNAGADDYLAKPFALEELIARVRSLGRRTVEPRPTLMRLADLSLNTVTRQAERGGKLADLSSREFRLLEFLMRHPGQICGRMMILEKVWDYDFDPGTNVIDVYIKRIREKIDDGFEPRVLHTVRNVGYVLREPISNGEGRQP